MNSRLRVEAILRPRGVKLAWWLLLAAGLGFLGGLSMQGGSGLVCWDATAHICRDEAPTKVAP